LITLLRKNTRQVMKIPVIVVRVMALDITANRRQR
jgi:hypothetical protein